MKKLAFTTLLIAFVSLSVEAQTAEALTEVVDVKFEKPNSPLMVRITEPQGLNTADKSRGFKLKKTKTIVKGYITDGDGLQDATINGKTVALASDGYFAINLDFSPGENELRISARDSKGNQEFKSYFFEAEGEDIRASPLLAVGDYHALIIGVNEYQDQRIVDLDKPIIDAKSLMNVLINNYTFNPDNVTLLENATRRDIIDALDNLGKRVTEADNVLIFYAGHGYWDTNNEIGYWIPSDARKSSTADWFRNSTLTDQIRSIRSKHTLLIADACFSGAIFKARAAFLDADKAINLKYSLPSRKAMTSGTLTEVPDRSAFIKYLVKRLGDNSQKYLAANDLFFSMEAAVINNSDADVKPQYGTIQKVGDEGGDFIFIRRE